MSDVKKTYTEDEHLAVLADRVEKETASLVSEKAALKEQYEAANAAAIAAKDAEIAALTAERDELKAQVEKSAREAAELKLGEERVEAAKAAAPGIPEGHFTPERAKAYGAMEEATWKELLATLSVAPAPTPGSVSREISSAGGALGGGDGKGENAFNLKTIGGAL